MKFLVKDMFSTSVEAQLTSQSLKASGATSPIFLALVLFLEFQELVTES